VTPESKRFAKRVFAAVTIIAAIAALAYAITLILLVFAGVLLAVLLRAAGTWLAERSRLSTKWSMVIVLAAFAGILFGTSWMFGVQIANQADQLFSAVSQAFAELQQKVREYRVAGFLISDAGHVNLGAPAKAAASGLLWVIASIVLVLFLGVYLSTDPHLYTELFLSFFDAPWRGRIERLLDAIASGLRWWLLGQFIAMGVVGVITAIGLLIIGAPMAISLSFLAALLTFVPYVGAVVSAVPAVLLAFTKGSDTALYVILVYLIAHVIEGYIVVPLVQHRMVYLPPALILATQFLMEIFGGILGVTLATPLMVVTMVLIKNLYFKQDWTEDISEAA
jgi:predicted PurR-regulated permease PerM